MTGQSRMQLEQLHSKRQAIEALGLKFGAKRIRVFGSVARGEENDRSELDFLIDFPRGYDSALFPCRDTGCPCAPGFPRIYANCMIWFSTSSTSANGLSSTLRMG